MSRPGRKAVTFYLPSDLAEWLRSAAFYDAQTQTTILIEALRRELIRRRTPKTKRKKGGRG